MFGLFTRGRPDRKARISNIFNLASILGCIIVSVMFVSLSILLLVDFTSNQQMIVNPFVYGTTAIGWILVLLGLGNLGLGWKRSNLQIILSGTASIENCGCISSIPIVIGLFFGLAYQVVPAGSPLDYFYLLPFLAICGMILIGFTFIIYRDRLKPSKYILYISMLYITVGAGTITVLSSGLLPISAGLIAWLLITSGPIFLLPLIWIFHLQRIVVPQQP
ncbi:MAG: hypothetical protein RTU63_04330 [Candidatus Thorarchaeota archaeon]